MIRDLESANLSTSERCNLNNPTSTQCNVGEERNHPLPQHLGEVQLGVACNLLAVNYRAIAQRNGKIKCSSAKVFFSSRHNPKASLFGFCSRLIENVPFLPAVEEKEPKENRRCDKKAKNDSVLIKISRLLNVYHLFCG